VWATGSSRRSRHRRLREELAGLKGQAQAQAQERAEAEAEAE
jgi:hypothetical protein